MLTSWCIHLILAIFSSGARIINAMVEYLRDVKPGAETLKNSILLQKSIKQRAWYVPGCSKILQQLSGIGAVHGRQLAHCHISTFEDISNCSDQQIQEFCGKRIQINKIRDSLCQIPLYEILICESESEIENIHLCIRNNRKHFHASDPSGNHYFDIIVSTDTDSIITTVRVMFSAEINEQSLQVEGMKGKPFQVDVIDGIYVGADVSTKYTPLNLNLHIEPEEPEQMTSSNTSTAKSNQMLSICKHGAFKCTRSICNHNCCMQRMTTLGYSPGEGIDLSNPFKLLENANNNSTNEPLKAEELKSLEPLVYQPPPIIRQTQTVLSFPKQKYDMEMEEAKPVSCKPLKIRSSKPITKEHNNSDILRSNTQQKIIEFKQKYEIEKKLVETPNYSDAQFIFENTVPQDNFNDLDNPLTQMHSENELPQSAIENLRQRRSLAYGDLSFPTKRLKMSNPFVQTSPFTQDVETITENHLRTIKPSIDLIKKRQFPHIDEKLSYKPSINSSQQFKQPFIWDDNDHDDVDCIDSNGDFSFQNHQMLSGSSRQNSLMLENQLLVNDGGLYDFDSHSE